MSVRTFLPLVSGYLVSWMCPMDTSAGENLPARPPSWVFGLVWPVLYLLLGWSWQQMRTKGGALVDVVFGANTALLALWLLVYSCGKNARDGVWVLVVALAAALAAFALCTTAASPFVRIALAPYLAWLFFATLLNFATVQQQAP